MPSKTLVNALGQIRTAEQAPAMLRRAHGQTAWFEAAQHADTALHKGRREDQLFWMAVCALVDADKDATVHTEPRVLPHLICLELPLLLEGSFASKKRLTVILLSPSVFRVK